MTDHEYVPSLNSMDQGDCAICGNSPGSHRERKSDRETFNQLAIDLGLTVTHTTTDGWHRSFTRPDGLHLWRASGFWEGCFIQTAYVQGDRYVNHQPFMKKANWCENLREAVLRDLPAP